MSDSIYRHDAIKAIETSRFLIDAIEKVMMLPTAQPKTGKWIKNYSVIRCSECKRSSWSLSFEDLVRSFNYCPNCGAKMKGGEKHD